MQKFNSGRVYQYTIGTTGVPYVTDNNHFNAPRGIAVDAFGNIIFSEKRGHRLLKLNSSGVPQWVIGQTGLEGSDNAHFSSSEGVAVDSSGNIYVADNGNHRVQIFDSNGTWLSRIGVTGVSGSDNAHFDWPTDVAVDASGNIYVADAGNHRVQKFNSSRVYVGTLGITGSPGSDNAHFDWPRSVAVDSAGNIYVVDHSNHRVQVFNSNFVYQFTIGETGVSGDDFAHFNHPEDVAVDTSDCIYVSDDWGGRIQVFDSNGNYLTTIGGSWGSRTGGLRDARGVAVDITGNVYIADGGNSRIQKFAPGVPGWRQVNINGFGYRTSYLVGALAPFGGQLYAGMYNPDTGAQLWRQGSDGTWAAIFTDGLGDASNVAVDHLIEFDGNLYAGIWNETAGGGSNGGQIWRSDTGNPGDWQMVASGGFISTDNIDAFRFAVFNNQLYTAMWNDATGGELWRSSSGDSGSWTSVVTGGFGDADNKGFVSLAEFSGHLYAGTDNWSGTEVWRSSTGGSGSWSQVNTDGFGDSYNWSITLEPFNGYLYAGTYNYSTSDNPGHELWRCQQCDGADWEQVPIAKGFGDTENRSIRSLVVFDNVLYALTYNRTTGMEVWRTTDGTNWEQIGAEGLGDSNNYSPYFDNSVAVFNDSLYIGTWNPANGGEIWHEIVDTQTPLALSADSGYGSIQLSWNPASDPGVTSYRISRRPSGSPTFTAIGTVNDTVYFDADGSLTPGASYCYQVEALRSDATVVGTSNEACATFGQVDLWVPDTWAAPGETVIVPVNIRNADGLRIVSSDIWLDYDPAVIEPVDVSSTALTEQYAWQYAIHSSGTYSQVRIASIASPPPVLYGNGSLFWFTFNVLGDENDTSPLNLREYIEGVGGSRLHALDESENPVEVPLFLQNGTLYVAGTGMLGDVDGDGVVGSIDAYWALQMAVGKVTPDWQQQYAGDVNGDGVISSADVTMILYYAAHEAWPLPSGGALSARAVSANPVLSLDDVSGAPGAVVTTTLRAADLQDWAGGDWIIAYDPTLVAEVTQVSVAGLSEGAPSQFYDDGAGLLRIAVAKGSAVSGDGALATISLRLASTPARDSASLTMATAKLNDVYGRDFSTSALQRTVTRQNGTVGITRFIYLPLVLRNH